jgi:hypothetical protein
MIDIMNFKKLGENSSLLEEIIDGYLDKTPKHAK